MFPGVEAPEVAAERLRSVTRAVRMMKVLTGFEKEDTGGGMKKSVPSI
jgi:hypothetical protein